MVENIGEAFQVVVDQVKGIVILQCVLFAMKTIVVFVGLVNGDVTVSDIIKNIVVVGAGSFIGGKESLMMLQSGNILGFTGYIALSVIAGVTLVALGYRVWGVM